MQDIELKPNDQDRSSLDWRMLLALLLTAIWLTGGGYYVGSNIGWSQFFTQPLDALGSFLEGAFAPLAFLWLVVGYFLQQKELARNTDAIQQQHTELERASVQAEVQAHAIQAYAEATQLQTFMRLHEVVRESLGAVIGMLYLSSQGTSGSSVVSNEAMSKLWSEMSRGDPELFARRFLSLSAQGEQDMQQLFYGTDIRTRHTENFLSRFERLLAAATDCDPNHLITDTLNGSVHGLLYRLMIGEREN